MHFDFKSLMGGLAVAIMLLAYDVQLLRISEGKSKPHPIAWFGFGFLTGIGYFVQHQKDAGPGSWVMGLTAIFCFVIAGASHLKNPRRLDEFDRWDWAALVLGIGLFALYLISKNLSWGPTVSAILATSADVVLYVPIFRQLEKEYAPAYGLNSLKFVPSLFAMNTYSTATCIYPVTMVIINGISVVLINQKKKVLGIT